MKCLEILIEGWAVSGGKFHPFIVHAVCTCITSLFLPPIMGALIRLLFAVFTAGLFITGLFYFIASVLGSIVFNPESRAWQALLAKLRDRVRGRMDVVLAPCDTENLSQLSLKPKILKKAGWRDSTFEGIFYTIYKEPLVVFAGQRSGKTAAIVARSSEHEFVFREKGKETEIWQDGQPFAVLVNGALLSAGKQGKLLAKFETDADLRQWPVLIGRDEAATLTNAERAVSPIPRALTLLRNMPPEEEKVLLLLSVMQNLPA